MTKYFVFLKQTGKYYFGLFFENKKRVEVLLSHPEGLTEK
jgi:hypothetical protein